MVNLEKVHSFNNTDSQSRIVPPCEEIVYVHCAEFQKIIPGTAVE